LQSSEECAAIKEKVKKYIAERNARKGVASSSSGDADVPSTPATKVPAEDAAQDGVEK
jgi:hypothetical protein